MRGTPKQYFAKGATLTPAERKFCRCALHVLAKNDSRCTTEDRRSRAGAKKCYDPYPVCAKALGTSTGRRSCQYDFENADIPLEEVLAYRQLKLDKGPPKPGRDEKVFRRAMQEWYSRKRSSPRKPPRGRGSERGTARAGRGRK